MEEAIITAVVFTAIYQIIKVFTDFLLKRRIVKAGHIEKAGILDPVKDKEQNAYPTLKWGLVALFAGLGLLLISQLNIHESMNFDHGHVSAMAVGIELVAISLGFLVYFFISQRTRK